MRRRHKLSEKEKVTICEQYLSGKKSKIQLASENEIPVETVRRWVNQYQEFGSSIFHKKAHNKKYTKEFKQEVVEAYLAGEGTPEHLANKYNIPSKSTVQKWIIKYNNLEELRDYNPKPEVYMKDRSRKTTYEERIEIVNYCLEHGKNYKDAAELFNVSYTQVYQWVNKYKEDGKEGLKDKRGKRKKEEQLSEIEQLQRKVKILERQIKEKEMENEVLKKVQEIERRRFSPKRKTKRNI